MRLVFVSSSFCLLFTSCLAAALQDQQEVEAGQNVPLQCQAPRNTEILMLEWTRSDLSPEDYVFFYREKRSYERYQHPSFRGRVKLRDSSSVEDGDVSVVLQNTSITDSGTYECLITVRSSGSSERDFSVVSHSINLTVTASAFTDALAEFGRGEDTGGVKGGVRAAASVPAVLLLLGGVFVAVRYCRKPKPPSENSSPAPPEHTPEQRLIQDV
ncbi:uncharacterized protein LOC121640518 [Melanotaenia boesemani]|uniref:uncharacterized protein LOC121640518 n=1 Tax=Melanotaenia boesemani TaxID=1250792 RepID=UPI001C05DB9A|nr:uncharacterized protein LOC121640518 [Melanotaenia boesemani]